MTLVSIVEDLPEIRSALERMIKEQPDMLLLSSSATAEEAMPLLLQAQPDVVVIDIKMPGISGIECIRKIKDDCPGTQFMIFTIYDNDEKIFDALAAGASSYLLKKTAPDKMTEAIRDLQNGGSPMSSQIARKVINYFNKKKNQEIDILTKRENEILLLLSKGFLYKEIGARLQITHGTVTQHLHNIYDKLHVSNKTEAINKFRNG